MRDPAMTGSTADLVGVTAAEEVEAAGLSLGLDAARVRGAGVCRFSRVLRVRSHPSRALRAQAQLAEESAVAVMRQASVAAAALARSSSSGDMPKAGTAPPSRANGPASRVRLPPASSNNPRLNKSGGLGGPSSFFASSGSLPHADAVRAAPPPPQLSLHAANIGRYYRYTPYGALTESLLEERDALCAGLLQLRGTLEAWEQGRIEELARFESQVR